MILFIIAYLLWCFSGWLALVKFFTNAHIDEGDGLDLSWCDCSVIALTALIPIFNVSMNFFWLWVWRQHIKRRPLINWSKIKCPVAIHGKRRK